MSTPSAMPRLNSLPANLGAYIFAEAKIQFFKNWKTHFKFNFDLKHVFRLTAFLSVNVSALCTDIEEGKGFYQNTFVKSKFNLNCFVFFFSIIYTRILEEL